MSRTMDMKQLTEHIGDTVKELLGGGDVSDLIRKNVETVLNKPPEDGGVAKHLMGGGEPEEPTKAASFGSYVRAICAGKNDPEKAAIWAAKSGYQGVADAITKAMDSGIATAGGFLVPDEFSQEVIELLRATGVVRGLNPTTIPMSSGSIKVPKITSGSSASYIGENTNIGKSELATGQVHLTFKKLAALVPISNDLIRYAGPSADGVVRSDVIAALSTREDLAFIRNDGTNGTPKGIKNWIHADNKFDADATNSLATVTNDLGKAMQRLMDAEINLVIQQGGTGNAAGTRAGWMMSPQTWRFLITIQTGLGTHAFRDEMLRGTLWGYPYRVTTQVESTTIYFGAFVHAVIGEALALQVDASETAAYNDGSSVQAAFSLDQTVIRVIAEHDFALRHDKAFALIEAVTYGA